jgi:hypothetical protein
LTPEELHDRCKSLGSEERAQINAVIVEDLTSPDDAAQYDAFALVDKFRIIDALPGCGKWRYD